MERFADYVAPPGFIDKPDCCWVWVGNNHFYLNSREYVPARLIYEFVTRKRLYHRQSPVRVLYERTFNVILPARFPLRPNRLICPTPLCVNPHHRIKPGEQHITRKPEPDKVLEYAAPDDVSDLIDLLQNIQQRYS